MQQYVEALKVAEQHAPTSDAAKTIAELITEATGGTVEIEDTDPPGDNASDDDSGGHGGTVPK